MNPSTQDVLRGCVQNLEELVMPEVTSPHAKSALMCVRMLINHTIVRIEAEGEWLAADCREKRDLLGALARAGGLPAALAAEVETLAADPEPAYTPVAALTERDDAWKRLFERVLDAPISPAVRASLRAQLAAQLERENACCAPVLDGPMF